MSAQERPYQPPLPWRWSSAVNIGVVGLLCRSFLYGLNRTEAKGLDQFLKILDSRKDEKNRTRGLVTVSNHVSVLDDPMIWGVLPYKYFWDPNNMRWSLGSYDICFKNKALEYFFSTGNTLPTHRRAHSPYGGLFQPTMTQVIRLLSDPHGNTAPGIWQSKAGPLEQQSLLPTSHHASFATSDPFSSAELTYSTNGHDSFLAPSAYSGRRHSWVHIFPEGMTHQHPEKAMRYFKWGVARLILEADPCPDVVPMWIDGPQHVYSHDRGWPKPMPRANKDISVTFGEPVDTEAVFGPYRERWQNLREKARRKRIASVPENGPGNTVETLGELEDDELRYGKEAEQLRIDVTMAVRNEVLKVRRASGLADEDPKRGLAETYREEGGKDASQIEGEKKDGSVIKPGI